jgi:hypothetical protein
VSGLAFDRQCQAIGLPIPVAEFRFMPERKFRFDWAIADRLIAIEVEGGSWTGGRHTRGAGFERDLEKYAEAFARGWRILRVSPAMIADGRAIGYLERFIRREGT